MTSPDAVEQHYSGRGLAERIFAALAAEGHDTGKLTPGILAPYDEFHVGGLAATERFSGRLSLDPALRLLDVGCGEIRDRVHGIYRRIKTETSEKAGQWRLCSTLF